MAEMQNIQWFPGHMAKTRRNIKESLRLIDAVAEIVDARVASSSRNPELPAMIGNKPLVVLLNKCDMADPSTTAAWIRYYEGRGIRAIPVDCKSGTGMGQFMPSVRAVLSDKIEKLKEKGMGGRPLRLMVVGIPNVGKSSFINRMARGAKAKVEDRPGVTRGNQWFSIGGGAELLDTPGVLWPKFDDQSVGERLAFTGAIRDNILDIETLAVRLIECLVPKYADMVIARYSLKSLSEDPYEVLCDIGRRRGMLISGGEIDTERAAAALLDDFRAARLGRISLESPEL